MGNGKVWRSGSDLDGFKWPLRSYAPGGYMGKCRSCGEQVDGIDKRASECLKCAIAATVALLDCMERALRIRIWNEARGKGQSDAVSMQAVKDGIDKVYADAHPTAPQGVSTEETI